MARDEGWLAEHMMISASSLRAVKKPTSRRLPSACGKTTRDADSAGRFRRLKVWTVGGRHRLDQTGADGRLYAINPEAGFFGVAPGTSMQTNPNAMKTMAKNSFSPTSR